MKKSFFALVVLSIIGMACTQPSKEPVREITQASLKTDQEKLSYAIGLTIGKQIHKDGMDIDDAILFKGVKDGLSATGELMTDEEIKATMLAFRRKMVEEKRKEANVNKKIGDEFLAGKKNEEGVIALESGLLYKVITQGNGKSPTPQDMVQVNYRGMTVDGNEFDSSYKRDKPASFKVNRVIKGWQEALPLMKEGDKWELYIPSELAYGPRGQRDIPSNSALIFEIELLSVEPGKPSAKMPKNDAPPPKPQSKTPDKS